MRDRRTSQRGFTLLELIVALGLGAIITLTLYTLTAGSGRIFHEQQRVAHTQLGLRNAMERIRADFARAGFLATPHSTFDTNVCPDGFALECPAPPFQGITVTNAGAFTHLPLVNTLATPDVVDLFGAFEDSNVYFSETLGNGTMTIDPNTVSFQQRFAGLVDPQRQALIDESFTVGQDVLRIHCPGEPVAFQSVAAQATIDGGGRLNIPYGPLRGVAYNPSSIGMRCEVSAATLVRYIVLNMCGDANFATTCRAGGEPEKSDLVRITLDPATGAPIAGTERIVAEYAVDFDVRFDVDTAAVPVNGVVNNPVIAQSTFLNGPNCAAAGAASPVGRMRAAEFRLSVRTRDEDPAFPWVAPGGIAPVVQRFDVNTLTTGAARVRTMTTKVQLGTFAALNIQRPALAAGCP